MRRLINTDTNEVIRVNNIRSRTITYLTACYCGLVIGENLYV